MSYVDFTTIVLRVLTWAGQLLGYYSCFSNIHSDGFGYTYQASFGPLYNSYTDSMVSMDPC